MKELNTFRQFLAEGKEEKVSEDKIERAIKATLKKEGGAAGIDPLKKAVKSLNVDTDFDIEKFLKKMSNVEKHKNGDYILTPLKENDEVLDEILNETAFDGFGDYRSKKEKEDDQEKLALLDDPIEENLNEAKAEDAKSYLESKGLKVEMVSTGNEGDSKASKFKGVSDIDADKIAYIWNNEAGNKFDGKDYFAVYMPFRKDLADEMKSKLPVLDVGGKSGTYYNIIIEKK
jgi:hypothetical protein